MSVMIKERRLRWLQHAARRSDNDMVTRDVKDVGQQMDYRSVDRMELAERSHEQTYLGRYCIVDGAKLFKPFS